MKKTNLTINGYDVTLAHKELYGTYEIEVTFNDKYTIKVENGDLVEALESMTDEVSFSEFVDRYNDIVERRNRRGINDNKVPF